MNICPVPDLVYLLKSFFILSLINWLCFYHGPVLSLGHKKSQWLPAGATPRTVSTSCQPAANVCILSSSRLPLLLSLSPGHLGRARWESSPWRSDSSQKHQVQLFLPCSLFHSVELIRTLFPALCGVLAKQDEAQEPPLPAAARRACSLNWETAAWEELPLNWGV